MSTKLLDRLSSLYEIRRNHLVILEQNYASKSKDLNGAATNSLAGTLRFLAVAAFVLDADCAEFHAKMRRVGLLRKELFDRAACGDEISPSYLSMLAYKQLFCALASGDINLSIQLAKLMGGRVELEKKHDHPFDRAFGYALKSVILRDGAQEGYVEEFGEVCKKAESLDFYGYYVALRALLDVNEKAANQSIVSIIKGHKNQSKGRGIFANTEDEVLCVWGIGIACFMKSRGINIESQSGLLPKSLIISI